MWRECIKKGWKVDPVICPKFTGKMDIVIFIAKKKVLKMILTHLNIFEEKKQRVPPAAAPHCIEPAEIVQCDDSCP